MGGSREIVYIFGVGIFGVVSAVPFFQQLGLVEQHRLRHHKREERQPSVCPNRIRNIDNYSPRKGPNWGTETEEVRQSILDT